MVVNCGVFDRNNTVLEEVLLLIGAAPTADCDAEEVFEAAKTTSCKRVPKRELHVAGRFVILGFTCCCCGSW